MPSWHFRITPEGEDDLDSLDKNLQKRVIEKLKWLVENFDKVPPLPLGGQWRGFFKLRVGDWRIIYEVDNDRTYALGVIPAKAGIQCKKSLIFQHFWIPGSRLWLARG